MIKVRPALGKAKAYSLHKRIPKLTVICSAPVTMMPSGALDGTPLANHCWVHLDGNDYILGECRAS